MKIAVGVRHFRTLGGAEKYVLQLVRYLADCGHEVTVYAVTGNPMEGVTLKLVPSPLVCPRFCRDWVTGRRIAHALMNSNADVAFGEQKVWNAQVVRTGGGVEKTYWDYHLLRKWKSRKVVNIIRMFYPKRFFDLSAERKSLMGPHVKAIIVNSNLVRSDMVSCYPLTESTIHVVHNGTGEVPFDAIESNRHRFELRQRLGLSETARLALFIGHDFYRKGLDPAIASLAMAIKKRSSPPWHLMVAGRGRVESYKAMAEKAGIGNRVHFLRDIKDASQAYAASDVMLLPSYYDPFAAVTVEAIGHGIPVITTQCNGGCEVINNGSNGWVVATPSAIEEMAEYLLKLSDDTILAAMKSQALKSSLQCKVADRLAEVEQILVQAAQERKSAG